MAVADEDYGEPSEADGFVDAYVVVEVVVDVVNTSDQPVEGEVVGATPSVEDQQHAVD